MPYDTLRIQTDPRGVTRVQLNLPDTRNALSGQMIAELTDFARGITAGGTTRVVVLGGAGKVFCAGGDLNWMKAQIDADRATRMAAARELAMMLRALNELPVPLIGKLHGGAYGGGIGLACVCDVAVADDRTTFGLTETRLGLIPATIGPYVLARLGEGKARRVFMSARVFDAAEAAALGVIARAVPQADLDAAIAAEIAPYLHTGPHAVAASKALARALGPVIDDAVIEATITRLADTWEGDEAALGIAAFLQKQPPDWG
ncbi:crotonase/enoyl-CoA hydratase family protein [Octadecabacter sp. R77987]|uniref:crotonase/enoyl-CoA hydratase family protein n=1 Tax=Octadecabacter sp. R77987 TaxID=3093874 RepID=UPI00366D8027